LRNFLLVSVSLLCIAGLAGCSSASSGGTDPSPIIMIHLSPTSGPVGTAVKIIGTNFGATQGTSTVTFNGTAGTPTSWSATSIIVPVPSTATTGNVVATVDGVSSNGVDFTVTPPAPSITSLSPTSGPVGTSVKITGTNFGATQGTSTVTFNGTVGTPTSWSATSIIVPVPSAATTGNVAVTIGGVAGNGVSFTVIWPGAPISDDFTGTTLNPIWTFYAACCGFEKLSGTDALLVVPSFTNHNIFNQNQGVGLLQAIANVDFDVVAKFDSAVTQGDQEEGILVQQDAQNFIYFGTYHDGTTPRIYTIVTANGTARLQYNSPITIADSGAPFYVRVTRSGANWMERWSTDGTIYSATPEFAQTIVASAIGPAAGNNVDASNNPAPSFTAAVDYFFNLASPISPSDGGMAVPPNLPVFNIWYGDNQTFGQNGIAQRWVNILGNVSAPSGIQSATYTLNGGTPQFLRVGPSNGTRLVDTGDFNVEIDHASLLPGANTVVITATDNQNHVAAHTVTLNWNYTSGHVWPLPYSIDWSAGTKIEDVAQIVDGVWAVQPDGSVRTEQVGYDRLIALGDVTWTDYQVTAEMTINHLDCTQFGAGLVVGWTGHTNDSTQPQPDQPGTGHPFFGLGWYATVHSDPPANAQLNIYANSPNYPEAVLIGDHTFVPVLGVRYLVKFAVQRNSNNTSSHFSLKIWPASAAEPTNWNLQADGDASTGSVLLGTFRADVSFGKIAVVPLP